VLDNNDNFNMKHQPSYAKNNIEDNLTKVKIEMQHCLRLKPCIFCFLSAIYFWNGFFCHKMVSDNFTLKPLDVLNGFYHMI
jgi:hypothetical protein